MTRFFARSPKRKLRAISAWLIVFAMLAQSFVPVGGALASAGNDAEKIFVCTVNGIQSVSLDSDGVPIESADQVSCPFCILHLSALLSGQNFSISEAPFAVEATLAPESRVNQSPASIWRSTSKPSRAPPSFIDA